mgnify:CR=1 FL=1
MPNIRYYTTPRGDCPFESFLDGSINKVRLRAGFGGDQYRAFYFFWDAGDIVVTHGLIKKSDQVPPGEIDRALRYRDDFLRRKASDEPRSGL